MCDSCWSVTEFRFLINNKRTKTEPKERESLKGREKCVVNIHHQRRCLKSFPTIFFLSFHSLTFAFFFQEAFPSCKNQLGNVLNSTKRAKQRLQKKNTSGDVFGESCSFSGFWNASKVRAHLVLFFCIYFFSYFFGSNRASNSRCVRQIRCFHIL